MTSSGRAPDDSRRPSQPPAWADPGAGGEGAALPRILSETVTSLATGDAAAPWYAELSAEDRGRLVHVVQSRGDRLPLDLTLASELVAAVLPRALAAIADGPEAQRRLIELIARSLLDDPQSAHRLEALVAAIRAESSGQAGASP